MAYHNILEKIGNTPIILINRINPAKKVKIYAKLESFNPGGSVKDRIALSMIETAEKGGELTPDKIVLEATSGNTGIGLAMVCAVKGYRCQLVMPESASIERRKIMEAYGAEILLTPAKRSTDGAIEQAYIMAREHPDRYFLTDQFNNEANWQVHYRTTGTAMGLCKYFAEQHPKVRVTAVEPFLGHKLQGLKNMKESYKPGIFDKNLPFQIINIPDDESFKMSRDLAHRDGIFVGMSSGAAMCAALTRSEQTKEGLIVVVLPDGGEKYLSTTLFSAKEGKKENTPREEQLRFYNSLKKKKEAFCPISKEKVTFYACGPTTHEHANLSHCRRFIVADLINRSLESKGFNVQFYMNFTDLDDNTINGAENSKQPLPQFTESYIREFKADMDTLGVKKPTGFPRASQHVENMIDITAQLIEKGYAYEKHGSIYFDISKFKRYGKLSGIDLSKIQIGKTVDLDDYDKESPVDFTLLKRSTLSELKRGIFYKTDWGNVRPGWHIECAAMSTHYLGDTIDIHTSGRDLIFPHHENEIAIAEALTGQPLANYWLHSEQLLVEGKKMSPENGNLLTLKDLLKKGYNGREIRLLLMATHYRKPLHFSFKKLAEARKNLRRLDEFTQKLLCLPPGLPHPKVASYLTDMEEKFCGALANDLNMSRALGAIFDFIKKINPILSQGQLDLEQKKYILETFEKINRTLNLLKLKECPLAPEIDRLIKDREEARRNKDWERADTVRNELAQKGVEIVDTPKGPVWKEIKNTEP
jgi:cysteinyl-tRNA synthetase